MTAYLINLKDETARLAKVRGQFQRLGLAFERLEAETEGPLDSFRWWCTTLRPVIHGEVGCACSHLKAYRTMLERGEKCAAVFEDDVVLSPRIRDALTLAEKSCLDDPKRVVLLGFHHRSKRGERTASADATLRIVPEDWDFCTEGYVIGREAAANLLRGQRRIRVTADNWHYFRTKGWITLSRVLPPVCEQDTDLFASALGRRYVAAEHGFAARMWWKFRRAIGTALDRLLPA